MRKSKRGKLRKARKREKERRGVDISYTSMITIHGKTNLTTIFDNHI